MGYLLKEITYNEAYTLINENAIIVLPIGGGAKEHGGHLPMGTDFYVTDWLANEVTKRSNVITLPTLPYAYFPAFVDWKASISIEHEHFAAFVHDILVGFIRFGVKKFLIIDGGVSTHPPLCILSRDMDNRYGVKIAVSDITKLAVETEQSVCEQKSGGHADESETSTMLFIREDLVHMEHATEEYQKPYPGTTENGILKIYFPYKMQTPTGSNGNSTLASKTKGEIILKAMVDALCRFLKNFDELVI